MELQVAKEIAERLVSGLRPYCERVEIAGSIRRQKAEGIKDVELVLVPKWEPSAVGNLFGEAELLNQALVWAFDADARGEVRWIKPGTSEVIPWEPKRDGKYWRGLLREGVKLDLFLVRPENFGLIYLIRTGSAEFSQAVVTRGKQIGVPCVEGSLQRGGVAVPTPEEEDVFRELGLAYVEPKRRTGPESLRGRQLKRLLADAPIRKLPPRPFALARRGHRAPGV